jgi:hypothetical protein
MSDHRVRACVSKQLHSPLQVTSFNDWLAKNFLNGKGASCFLVGAQITAEVVLHGYRSGQSTKQCGNFVHLSH